MTEQTFRDTPYKGLVPYSEEDAAYFFGREAEREIITANLMASRLTLLYGASGVGKSSVLRAGVAHSLQRLAQKNLSDRGAPEFGVLVFNSWRDNPVEVLERRLDEALSPLAPNRGDFPASGSRELPEILKDWSDAIDGDLFIILDQFEEYFLYHAQEDGDNSFAVQFPRAVNRSDLRVSFLISIREDALAKLDRFKGRIPNLFDNYLRIDHLDRNAARTAITEPAATYNSLHPESSIHIESSLVEAVLDQVRTDEVVLGGGGRGVVETTSDQSCADERIETSYLQLVMTRLWQEEVGAGSRKLQLATLNTLGGAKTIVQTHVDAVMQRLEADEQRAAAQLFYFLVTRDGTKIAHTVSALSEYTRLDETRLTGVLEKLCGADARILQPVDPPPGQPDSPRYEIRHDKLAAAILDWRRRYAQKEGRAEAERLAQQAEAQARVEEKAKSAARLRWLSIALAVMTLLASVMAAYAFKQRSSAVRDAQNATAQATEAEKQKHFADEQRVQADEQREFASKQAQLAEVEGERANEAAKLARARAAEADKAKAEAEAARGEADRQRKRANEQAVIAKSRELAAASKNTVSTDPELSVLLALHAVAEFEKEPGIAETEKKEAIDALHEATQASRVRHTLNGHTKLVMEVTYDRNGKFVVTRGNDDVVKLWDAKTGTWLRDLVVNAAGSVNRMVVSHNGTRVAISIEGGAVEVQDLATGQIVLTVPSEDAYAGIIAFSKDDSMLAVASGKILRVWNLATNKPQELPYELPATIERLVFTEGGKRLVVGGCPRYEGAGCTLLDVRSFDLITGQPSQPVELRFDNFQRLQRTFSPIGDRLFTRLNDGTAKLWDTNSGKELFDLSNSHVIFPATFSDDGKQLATMSENGSVVIWDVSKGASSIMLGQLMLGQLETTLSGGGTRFSKRLAFSPNGDLIAAFGGKTVEVWDVKTRQQLLTLSGHKSTITSLGFAPEGHYIATGSADGTVKIWDTTPQSELLILSSPPYIGLTDLRFSPDGKHLAGSLGSTMKEWDANSGKELSSMKVQDNAIIWFALSPDWKLLAFLSGNVVNIWNTSSRKSIWSETKQSSERCKIAFSPNGKLLAGGRDNIALVWNVQTGDELHSFVGHGDTLTSVGFSPDSQILATGSSDGTAKLWDVKTGKELRTLKGHTRRVSSVCFSIDGKRLVTAGYDSDVKIWDVSTGKELISLSGHSAEVNDVAFSSDGRLIATASDDGTAKLWLANTGQELVSLDNHAARVFSVAFSPDSSRLVVTNSNGDALVHTVGVSELINLAKQRVSRLELTTDERKRYLHESKKE